MTDDSAGELRPFIPAQLDDYGLPATTFRVYAAVCRNAGKDSVCFASVKTLARRCRLHLDTVRACLKTLHALGLIGKKENAGQTTSYTVMPLGAWKPSPFIKDPSETEGGATKPTPRKAREGGDRKRRDGSPTPRKRRDAKGIPLKGIPPRPSREGRARTRMKSTLGSSDSANPFRHPTVATTGASAARRIVGSRTGS